jgi:dienelactone hydrolase
MSSIDRRSVLKMGALAAAAWPALRAQRLQAAAPTAYVGGALPNDRRLSPPKDYNGYFPWTPPESWEEWQVRAEYVRRQMQVACGLWPMPERTPLNATIHGKVERDDFTVERVYFESHPGLFVTGSLYRPKGDGTKRPIVLCPHGHWINARFYSHDAAKIKQEIELGAEIFEQGGRTHIQARCVHLARMGCAVFLYDMLGYSDNTSLSYQLIHGFAKQRPEMSQPDHWGLFSPQSEMWLLNALGLQTWNSIRALDWMVTLPDVDTTRIGVTGASGGGTQTFMLACLDDRVTAAFPAVMVSTSMQGGCTCENTSYLRVNTGNIEFAALVAPRPIAMTAAKDWTVELETKGLPELKTHFARMGVPDNVNGKFFPFEHNYNHPSRMMMYDWFNKHLKLGAAEPIQEKDYAPLSQEELTVWNDAHPAPATGDEAELKILRSFADEFQQQFKSLIPRDAGSLAEYRRVIGGGWDILIGRKLPRNGALTTERVGESDAGDHQRVVALVRTTEFGEEIPTLLLLPRNWNGSVAFWFSDGGKADLLGSDDKPVPGVAKLLSAGSVVVGADLFRQGEFLKNGDTANEWTKVANPREFVGYTFGFNHPLFSQRTHDILTLLSGAKYYPTGIATIYVVGQGHSSLYAAAAIAQAPGVVTKAALSTDGYRFAGITEWRDPMLLPGALRYGDVPGLLALAAPTPLWLAGEEGTQLDATTAAYKAASAAGKLVRASATGNTIGSAAADWLLG